MAIFVKQAPIEWYSKMPCVLCIFGSQHAKCVLQIKRIWSSYSHWNDAGSSNPVSSSTRIWLSCIAYIADFDVQTTQGAISHGIDLVNGEFSVNRNICFRIRWVHEFWSPGDIIKFIKGVLDDSHIHAVNNKQNHRPGLSTNLIRLCRIGSFRSQLYHFMQLQSTVNQWIPDIYVQNTFLTIQFLFKNYKENSYNIWAKYWRNLYIYKIPEVCNYIWLRQNNET